MRRNDYSPRWLPRALRIVVLLAIVAGLVAQPSTLLSTARQALAEQPEVTSGSLPTSVPTCALYTVSQEPGRRSQLLALDLRNQQSYLLGDVVDAEISGLAVHPETGILYAVSGERDGQPGILYSVDRTTGTLTAIGPHGFASIVALAFRWTDATLWGWAEGSGLVQVDTDTGAASLHLASDRAISGLAWTNDGQALYAIGSNSLWSYREEDPDLQRVAKNLPRGAAALDIRSDGLLLGLAGKDEPKGSGAQDAHPLEHAWVFIYDPSIMQVVSETAIPTSRRLPGIAGLAWPRACGNASPGGPADIIQTVILDKTHVCPGEDVHVTVEVIHPESPQGVVDVAINGQWGSDQYLQFTGAPGERLIAITASTPEKFTDSEEVTIEVLDCGAEPEYLDVAVYADPYEELVADFEVANGDDFADQGPTYHWEFGDGQTLDTAAPYASHSYADAMAPDEPYTTFQATVTLQRTGHEDLTAAETVTMWNVYAVNKQMGLIQPRVEADERLQKEGESWIGHYSITNLEDRPIDLTSRQLAYQPCDPDLDPVELPWEEIALTLAGGEALADALVLDAAAVPEGVCGVALHLAGEAESGEQVGVHIYFQIVGNPMFEQPVSDEPTLTLLNDLADQGLVPNPDYITDEDLYRLQQEGQAVTLATLATVSQMQAMAVPLADPDDCDGKPKTPNPIGCECMPGDPVPDKPDTVGSLSCSATREFTRYPAHIPNAQKGDLILSAECGLVGGLLRQLTPPQLWSHVGIMTRDYYEITHSTSSEERYEDEDNLAGTWGSEGIKESVLRYGWPGVITQSIDEAFNGQSMTDPDGKTFVIRGFHTEPASCGKTGIVYPMVVKPPPALAQSVRPLLEAAADKALTIEGHYRFYAYSDAAIARDRSYDGPESPEWATGSAATVCSQFVWYSLKQVPGIQLEGAELEEADQARGGEPNPYFTDPLQDGLYLYRADERLAAGLYVYTQIRNQVFEMYPGLPEWLMEGSANKFGNQLANCLASDDCSSDNGSQAWKAPTDGIAVSPDNTLLWDSPETGGVYGYSERLAYRSGAWARVYRWAPSEGTGTVTGVVTYQGAPMEGAEVTLRAAGNLVTASDAEGGFEFLAVPEGTYEIVAQKALGDIFLSSHSGECTQGVCRPVTVDVNADQTADVSLILLPPPVTYRRVAIYNNLHHQGLSSDWPDGDEYPYPHVHGWYVMHYIPLVEWGWKIAGVSNLECRADPFVAGTLHWEECFGVLFDETCLSMDVTCTLLDNEGSVRVDVTGNLHAGSGYPVTTEIVLGPGESKPYEYWQVHPEFLGEDRGALWLKFVNLTQY